MSEPEILFNAKQADKKSIKALNEFDEFFPYDIFKNKIQSIVVEPLVVDEDNNYYKILLVLKTECKDLGGKAVPKELLKFVNHTSLKFTLKESNPIMMNFLVPYNDKNYDVVARVTGL